MSTATHDGTHDGYEYLTREEADAYRQTGALPSRIKIWPDTGASKRILRVASPAEFDEINIEDEGQ